MNSSKANILNAICLIAIGLWGYIEVISPTALIPVGFGAALAFCIPGLKKDNKVMAHIAVLLTFAILIALVGMRLPKSIDQGGLGLVRVLIMIGTSTLSMVYFVKSFIANRKAKS
ncbi:MAG: hypothetical protein O3C01_07280 [Bacteroidetes bacterium]|jgi:hypothetical protein|nr:MAG: hypothetical protein ABR90_05975 [Cryomorphaceae bacterium BACL29 MAG-121220-bin8]MDA0758447.1 hypothetical protein [Bacteroidota bacterium]MDA1019670.1 hypothetical protein [Bacteroidota bacterium]|tara:strand:- start:25440 stop:25784 length:345 start_codon:yes stop_codon:yes gene_type:complete